MRGRGGQRRFRPRARRPPLPEGTSRPAHAQTLARLARSPASTDRGTPRTLGKIVGPGGKLRGAREGCFRFLGGEAFGPHHRLTVVGLQLKPPPRRGSGIRAPRRRALLVRRGARLAE